jgi:hypothetical protein
MGPETQNVVFSKMILTILPSLHICTNVTLTLTQDSHDFSSLSNLVCLTKSLKVLPLS